MINRLNALKCVDGTLEKVSEAIIEKVEFYDQCLKSWDQPNHPFSAEDIEMGKNAVIPVWIWLNQS